MSLLCFSLDLECSSLACSRLCFQPLSAIGRWSKLGRVYWESWVIRSVLLGGDLGLPISLLPTCLSLSIFLFLCLCLTFSLSSSDHFICLHFPSQSNRPSMGCNISKSQLFPLLRLPVSGVWSLGLEVNYHVSYLYLSVKWSVQFIGLE